MVVEPLSFNLAGGNLEFSEKMEKTIVARLEHLGRFWMFDSDDCINGLATGKGNAVSFSGTSVIVGGSSFLVGWSKERSSNIPPVTTFLLTSDG